MLSYLDENREKRLMYDYTLVLVIEPKNQFYTENKVWCLTYWMTVNII